MLIMPEVDYIAPYPKLSDALTPVLIIVRLSCLGVAVGSILIRAQPHPVTGPRGCVTPIRADN
jgi:hypothetical protein